MSLFRTEIQIPPSEIKLNYHKKILLIGSCFSENIGNILHELKFPILINPFGILYNPLSIINTLERIVENKPYSSKDIDEHNGLYFSFDHHGRFSDLSKDICLNNINHSLEKSRRFLEQTDVFIITFGTSWVYRHKGKNKIVANCHKKPASCFERFFIHHDHIIKEFQQIIEKLKSINKKIRFIFTVSPIRHWKDGAIENQRSKSNLCLAIHGIISKNKDTAYFPSYEIMMDDLRDYRFYSDDMLHPGNIAIKYIWHKFRDTYIEKEIQDIMQEIEKINQAVNHKPVNPGTEQFKKFVNRTLNQIKELESKYPFINFEEQKGHFLKS